MLKTRSVDVRRDPADVVAEARAGLEQHLDVVEVRWLEALPSRPRRDRLLPPGIIYIRCGANSSVWTG